MTAEGLQFYRIFEEGILQNSFTAVVEEIEDKPFLDAASGACYVRMILSQQDGNSKIVALVWGELYELVKDKYKDGESYLFPGGTFRTKMRSLEFQSWSNCLCDLILLKVDNVSFEQFFLKQPRIEENLYWLSCANAIDESSTLAKSTKALSKLPAPISRRESIFATRCYDDHCD